MDIIIMIIVLLYWLLYFIILNLILFSRNVFFNVKFILEELLRI